MSNRNKTTDANDVILLLLVIGSIVLFASTLVSLTGCQTVQTKTYPSRVESSR